MEAKPRSRAWNLAIVLIVLVAVGAAIVAVATMDPSGRRGPKTGRRYADAARQKATIDPALLRWQEVGPPLALDLEEPTRIAVDAADRIWAAGERLLVFEKDGRPRAQSEEFPELALAVEVAADGRVLVAFAKHVLALRGLDALGEVLRTWKIDEHRTELVAITGTPLGVFVADAGRCRVLRLLETAGGDGPAFETFAEGFHVPSCFDLARTKDGDVVTIDPGRGQVQVRSSYGDVVRRWGQLGETFSDFHGCCNPVAVAVMADGRVVTTEKGLAATRVKVHDAQGNLVDVVAGPRSFDERPDGPPIELDVAVDSRGRVLVLDPARRQVRIFTRKEGR